MRVDNEKKFPKVNYIGNKEKLADWIIDSLPIKNGVVLDGFSEEIQYLMS